MHDRNMYMYVCINLICTAFYRLFSPAVLPMPVGAFPSIISRQCCSLIGSNCVSICIVCLCLLHITYVSLRISLLSASLDLHACLPTYMHTYIHTYVHTCIHTYINVCILTYMHSSYICTTFPSKYL